MTVDGATSNNGNNRFDNIHFTGESGVPAAEQPVFSVTTGSFCAPIEVTMTCGTENASIYYTLDGTEPDNVNGTLYLPQIASVSERLGVRSVQSGNSSFRSRSRKPSAARCAPLVATSTGSSTSGFW